MSFGSIVSLNSCGFCQKKVSATRRPTRSDRTNLESVVRRQPDACFRFAEQEHGFEASPQPDLILGGSGVIAG
jgi:hypothetical protein